MTRSIVITGASKGIGRAAAEGLAAAGWEVIGIARHTPTNFPGQFVPTDLSDPQGTAELDYTGCILSATRNGQGAFGSAHSDLESRWPLVGHAKAALKRQPNTSQHSLVEQLADQRNTMRHPARRRKLEQCVLGVRRPVASSFRHLDEPRSQGKRKVPCRVGDDQYFIAQRRHQQQIYLGARFCNGLWRFGNRG